MLQVETKETPKRQYMGQLEDTSLLYLADDATVHNKGLYLAQTANTLIPFDAGFEWP